MGTFEQYLKEHTIEPLRPSIIAGVCSFTVVGNSKSRICHRTLKIRVALNLLPESAYESFLLTSPLNQLPIISLKMRKTRLERKRSFFCMSHYDC